MWDLIPSLQPIVQELSPAFTTPSLAIASCLELFLLTKNAIGMIV